jgi:hypothetical protein
MNEANIDPYSPGRTVNRRYRGVLRSAAGPWGPSGA